MGISENNFEESVNKYYNDIKTSFDKIDLQSNILIVIIVGMFLLWIVIGFSGSFMVIFLLITNIVCLYFTKKNGCFDK